MSRSHRKSPFTAHSTIKSERFDKQQWHSNWRAKERTALAIAASTSSESLEAHQTIPKNQVSSTWHMAKDGKSYWPLGNRLKVAELITRKTLPTAERNAIKTRLLKKWSAK